MVTSAGGNDGGGYNRPLSIANITDTAYSVVPTGTYLKGCLALSVALYVLNQKHFLPRPLASIVSKVFFWPTLPLTAGKLYGKWSTAIDNTVVLGAAPFGFANVPERLYNEYGVRGVINLCEEYSGPDQHYQRLGMKHLRLPTVDHFEPTVEDMEKAVSFIQKHKERGEKVYVHCRAGHGRSAAIVFAWLISQDPSADLEELNKQFYAKRHVRKKLWKQTNIREFHRRLRTRGIIHGRRILKGVSDDEISDEEGDGNKEL
ncbi:Phosphatidylglycerophosphatase and protein-tyrosine phosphatase 1 [Seminavis robusta]|uniref:Phosphatidylglycerophosphatase and protein-tyrosine phosphatase 1 n=1 Tax=Seminavis robusta TaxID=568900 RepID=A0A9N8HDI2_9STRA|nr:Phosphatidylglycerophosphatase and protein-tyrosine phosphatase 1 [Seminavis robusta]|eukprot:Sro361_g126630.1 Phosphatidylglycerophosphatase and protein-tyrosine phosphatase 1 (260) ;mRNA; f:59866-60732